MTEAEATNGQEGTEPKQRNTILIAAVVIILLLLCCCGFLAIAWFFGDTIVDEFGSLILPTMVGLL